jgi:hypothetical protein
VTVTPEAKKVEPRGSEHELSRKIGNIDRRPAEPRQFLRRRFSVNDTRLILTLVKATVAGVVPTLSTRIGASFPIVAFAATRIVFRDVGDVSHDSGEIVIEPLCDLLDVRVDELSNKLGHRFNQFLVMGRAYFSTNVFMLIVKFLD